MVIYGSHHPDPVCGRKVTTHQKTLIIWSFSAEDSGINGRRRLAVNAVSVETLGMTPPDLTKPVELTPRV